MCFLVLAYLARAGMGSRVTAVKRWNVQMSRMTGV